MLGFFPLLLLLRQRMVTGKRKYNKEKKCHYSNRDTSTLILPHPIASVWHYLVSLNNFSKGKPNSIGKEQGSPTKCQCFISITASLLSLPGIMSNFMTEGKGEGTSPADAHPWHLGVNWEETQMLQKITPTLGHWPSSPRERKRD